MDDPENAAISKLAHADGNSPVIFTPEEAIALREVALWWTRLKGASAVGGVMGTAAKWFVIVLAGVAAAKAGFLEWLGGMPK